MYVCTGNIAHENDAALTMFDSVTPSGLIAEKLNARQSRTPTWT